MHEPLLRHPPGSIPACAGEPGGRRLRPSRCRVYPRVCGGTKPSARDLDMRQGLSPRVRGNRPAERPAVTRSGSIPACAGEPRLQHVLLGGVGVYPRVCGGTPTTPRTARAWQGLSPRVRGNPRAATRSRWCPRSIPACAGEPSPSTGWASQTRVYPRVCGGTRSSAKCAICSLGLSPRVRGNPALEEPKPVLEGSIPACAGEPTTMST